MKALFIHGNDMTEWRDIPDKHRGNEYRTSAPTGRRDQFNFPIYEVFSLTSSRR